MGHRTLVRLGAATASLLLLAAGCSSDRGGEDNTGSGDGDVASDTAEPAADLPTDTFGDLEVPCGEGDASGATDDGVTDDTISIGFGDDKGYSAAPGLNQEMGDAMEAFISWCNDLGGINGRQIEGHRYDAKIFDAAQVQKESCSQDFMMVGQGFGLDENAEPERIACGMPTVPGFMISQAASMGPMQYTAVPGPADEFNPAMATILSEQYPEFADVGFVNSDSPAVDQGEQRYIDNFEYVGSDVTNCGLELKSAGGDNYRAVVETFKQCGVTSLFTLTPPSPPLYNFRKELVAEGLDLPMASEATWYADGVLQSNVDDLNEGVLVGMQFQPFENADIVPAVEGYLSIMDASGGVKGLLGMQSASSFLLWATVAKECGSDLTRQCMVDGLSQVHAWTGGGLHAETDPGDNRVATCGLMTQVEGQEFAQVFPKEPGEFFCVDKPRPGEVEGIELTDDRIATKYLTDDVLVPSK